MASGGARQGAGRKALLPGDKKVQMVITIDADTRTAIKAAAAANNTTPGKYIARLIAGLK